MCIFIVIFVIGEDYIWGNGKVGVKCKGKTFHYHYTTRYTIEAAHFSFVSDMLYISFDAKSVCNVTCE